MSLIGQKPHQVPVNGMLGSLAYWSYEQFKATVNALIAAGITSPFGAGTRMIFQQTAAPTGWTKDTTLNDRAMRIVSGTVSSGGSVAFSSAFASRSLSGSIASTTLSTSQMPSHGHSLNAPNSSGIPTSNRVFSGLSLNYGTGAYYAAWLSDRAGYNEVTAEAVGGGGSHTHGLTLNALDMAVRYTDVIVATKD